MSDRKCDGCTVCCETVKVDSFDKPPGVKCQHQCALGCKIYDARPSECEQYSCSWLEGRLPEELKPNECGWMAETMWIETAANGRLTILVLWEQQPGAIERSLPQLEKACRKRVALMWAAGDGGEGMTLATYDEQDSQDVQQFLALVHQQGYVDSMYTDGMVRHDMRTGKSEKLQK